MACTPSKMRAVSTLIISLAVSTLLDSQYNIEFHLDT